MSVVSRFEWTWVHTHLQPVLRFGSAGLLLGPGVSKVVTYEQSVRFFRELGIPSPELLVPIVGALELLAALLFVIDRVPWLGAFVVTPIMLVAAVTAGPSWQNVGLLGAVLLLVLIDVSEMQNNT
jgi:uncharacterized membrane protein YphA (DoxX/SURF4 family)